jgi:hypothetical protein
MMIELTTHMVITSTTFVNLVDFDIDLIFVIHTIRSPSTMSGHSHRPTLKQASRPDLPPQHLTLLAIASFHLMHLLT